MIRELKISEAKKHPADFLYIFASEKDYLQKIPAKYANIIRGKAANQRKLLMLSAQKYKMTYAQYEDAVYNGFIDIYGITPAQALIDLANGKVVAGKNWRSGVFGIGALKRKSFAGTGYSVDPDTGTILDNGVPTPESDVVYKDVNGETKPYQIFSYDNTTNSIYMSQLDESTGKYYAAQKTNENTGEMFDALGNATDASNSASVWGNVIVSVGDFLAWLISLLTGGAANTITEQNTLPNQSTDGFVTEAGMGEAGMIFLALAAGGVLLASGSKNKK